MVNKNELPKGFMGKVLEVNLSDRSFRFTNTDHDFSLRFFGGRGMGVALMFRHFNALKDAGSYKNPYREVDGLSPDNVVVISTSPATGTRMPGAGRFHMNFKSPLTGGIGSTDTGGFWGVQLKQAGIDAVIILGKAEEPTNIVIEKEEVTFHNAQSLQGLSTEETNDVLVSRLPKGARVLSIGDAGKNMVRFAAVINEKGRAFGRSGGGAVWGSKNLHAIAVVPDPSIKIEVDDPEKLNIKNKEGATFKTKMMLDLGKLTRKEDHYGILSSLGSLGLLGMVNNHGQLPHNNMRDTYHDDELISKISGEALRKHKRIAGKGQPTVEVKKGTCFNCPVACKRNTKVLDKNGEVVDQGEGPEFETVTLLGANLSIYDLPLIIRANYAANRYGLDTISLGSTIASFFDLYTYCAAKETLSEDEHYFMKKVDPFVKKVGEPVFGNTDVLLPLIDMVAAREGIGDELAEGSYLFCSSYGHPEFSMTVKGQEL
ncbi:MAG: aldehyde ferredoxin oxidoreductase N-terminal domain-containing protein, partial [Spirochaetia bacterium]